MEISEIDAAGRIVEKGKEVVKSDVTAAASYRSYPKAEAKYQEVVDDANLFRKTLEKLHGDMGTKFMIPVIGGKELDLHHLFVEVTSRGGIEKVIADRRWREVTAAFTFPSTATNASFVLRKYYMSLLNHYEQVYFFGSEGWRCPSAPSSVSPTSRSFERTFEPSLQHNENQFAVRKRRKNDDVPTATCPQVVGVIDGKFEYGYFVTVTLGSSKLKGVLYHIPEKAASRVSHDIAYNNNAKVVQRRRRRKKLSKRDPAHPKPNRSGYNFFFAEQHARLKPVYPGKDREISRMIGELWNKLTETEKAVYQERGVKDKERYQNEMLVYKERLKTGQIISHAVPIQQLPAEPDMMTADTVSGLGNKNFSNFDNDNELSSDGSDLEADEDSEDETSREVGATAARLATLTEPSTGSNNFELKKRENVRLENEHLSSLREDIDPMKVMVAPTVEQEKI